MAEQTTLGQMIGKQLPSSAQRRSIEINQSDTKNKTDTSEKAADNSRRVLSKKKVQCE